MRLAAVLAVMVIGSIGGVYIGNALTRDERSGVRSTVPILPSDHRREIEPLLRFSVPVGQPFPNESFETPTGRLGKFAEFFDGTPSVLLFWNLDCVTCVEQAHLWRAHLEPLLQKNMKQVACISDEASDENRANWHLLSEKTVVYIDYDYFREELGLKVLPTIIAVDGAGLIQHIQYEFSPLFDEAIVSFVTEHGERR
jgi:thiol-disulfide isomerase/thioredoxin